MAARRVAKTSVEWAKLQKLLPQDQQNIYNNLLAKNFQFTSKYAFLLRIYAYFNEINNDF
jgi:hypothetical protein